MTDDTLIREVDEELRRDRLRKLWRQLAPFVIGGAVAVVLGVAGYETWTWWQKTQAAKSSDQFYAATSLTTAKDLDAAKAALDGVVTSGSGGYPMLAKFREAALLAQQGKTDEAVAAYDGLASSLDNTHLRELALVLAANLLIDKGDVAAVQQRVGGLMVPGSALANAAREALGLTQYKAGKLDDAMQTFQAIVDDPLANQDVQSRVQVYMQQLISEGAKAPASSQAIPAPGGASAEPSAAVDASTELDVTPPVAASAPASAALSSEVSSAPSSSAP